MNDKMKAGLFLLVLVVGGSIIIWAGSLVYPQEKIIETSYNLTSAFDAIFSYNGTAYKLTTTVATHYSIEMENGVVVFALDTSIREITNQTITIPQYKDMITYVHYWALVEEGRFVLIRTEAITK